MRGTVFKLCKYSFCLMAVGSFFIRCANRGIGPQGGAIDSIPPVVVSENPKNGSIFVHQKDVEITFNEYIKLNNVQSNVFISPPPTKQPEIQAIGKKIKIQFEDSLVKNTTYFINFGDAIGDNNENNILKDYSLSFSTGRTIDSLGIFGQLVNAVDLNPVSDVVVGIHDDLSDTALFSKPFVRIGKTDEYGMFSIKNVAAGKYKIYAINDISKDFIYQPGEHIAFFDSVVIPTIKVIEYADTIFKDSILQDSLQRIVDKIAVREERFAEPADILLFLFLENSEVSYFRRSTRNAKHMFELMFSGKNDTLPQIKALRPNQVDSTAPVNPHWVDWSQHMVVQKSKNGDTIRCWLVDSTAMSDTLYAQIRYLCSDSNRQLISKTDTLNLIYRPPKLNNRALAKLKKKEEQRKVNIRSNGKENFEIYDTLCLFFDYPLRRIHEDSFHLYSKQDTVRTDIDFRIRFTDSSYMQCQIVAPIVPEKSYYLVIDSGGVVDIYGHVNDVFKTDLRVKAVSQYATLNVILKNHKGDMRLQLLDGKETVVFDVACPHPSVKFVNLKPQEYYLRLYYDLNADGKYTVGDIKTKRQPEPMFYFPSKLNLRANWDFEETFDPTAIDQLQSKPIGIVKDMKTTLIKSNK